jgi:acyl dehydratase
VSALRHLEDLPVGLTVTTVARTVGEADIATFAEVSGDFNALHTDDDFVREHTPYRGRIAHGLLVLAISSGLASDLDDVESIAYLEEGREFVAPTYPGDTIHAVWTVEESRPSRSRPGAGVVRLTVEVVNQDGEVVQRGHDVWLVACRPEGAA